MIFKKENSQATTVLLCGVGGQGTILAADLLARCALAAGLEVKLSEVHGMAQRGGAVTTVVRFGQKVTSMVTDFGSADHVIAFETTEALRNIAYLKKGGTMLVNDESIKPLPVLTGQAKMPLEARETLLRQGAHLISAGTLAEATGSAKSTNVVLLGALSSVLDFEKVLWQEQITKCVPPKTLEANRAAFHAGVQYMRDIQGSK